MQQTSLSKYFKKSSEASSSSAASHATPKAPSASSSSSSRKRSLPASPASSSLKAKANGAPASKKPAPVPSDDTVDDEVVVVDEAQGPLPPSPSTGPDKERTMEFNPCADRQKDFVAKLGRASAEDEHTDDPMRGKIGGRPLGGKLTPMEQQIVALKKANPDCMLMVECGYRFRFFGDDALKAAKVLGIYTYIDHSFYVASVPTVRCRVHIRRLCEAGFKVAVVRQTETAALKAAGLTQGTKSGMFERKVVAVFTQATFNEDDPALAFVNQMVRVPGVKHAVKAQPGVKGTLGGRGGGKGKGGKVELEEADDEDEGDDDELDDDGGGEAGDERGVALGSRGEHGAGIEQWLMCVHEEQGEGGGEDSSDKPNVRVAVVAVNTQTGVVVHDVFDDGPQRMELDTRIRQLQPLELLLPHPSLSKQSETCVTHYQAQAVDVSGRQRVTRIERIDARRFEHSIARRAAESVVSRLNSSGGTTGANLESLPRECVSALGPLVEHLRAFGIDRVMARPSLRPFATAVSMTLDGVTIRDLEIFNSSEGKEQGSLFHLLDRTTTPFGSRRLREWMRKPLVRATDVRDRLDAVDELANDFPVCLEALAEKLKRLPDLESIISQLHYRKTSPKRLIALLRSVLDLCKALPTPSAGAQDNGGIKSSLLRAELASVPQDICASVNSLMEIVDVEAANADNKPMMFADASSFFPKLTAKKEALNDVELGLQEELQAIRSMLRKPSLEYKTLRTSAASCTEYLIELKKGSAEMKAVPQDWTMVSQTKDFSRYHTPKVLNLMRRLLVSREEVQIAGDEAFQHFVATVDDNLYNDLRALISVVASFDAMLGLAKVAQSPGYVKPVMHDTHDGRRIHVVGGRHPVLEHVMSSGSSYVPNDVDLGSGDQPGSCLVVTGPNMGGKTSYVRMVALLSIMGQVGSYVPAESAELAVLDGVYTRMGAGDDLAAGMSTFLVELNTTSFILKKATSRSMVILDELGRGTSTFDGLAIAEATLKYLVRRVGCSTLFVTHYPQLAELANDPALQASTGESKVRAAHMGFVPANPHGNKHDIAFLYKLVDGGAKRSYGLNVARMVGIDDDLIELAAKKSRELERRFEPESPESEGADKPSHDANCMDVDPVEDSEVADACPLLASSEAHLAKLREYVTKLEELEESGVSQKVYVQRKRAILQEIIEVQNEVRKEAGISVSMDADARTR